MSRYYRKPSQSKQRSRHKKSCFATLCGDSQDEYDDYTDSSDYEDPPPYTLGESLATIVYSNRNRQEAQQAQIFASRPNFVCVQPDTRYTTWPMSRPQIANYPSYLSYSPYFLPLNYCPPSRYPCYRMPNFYH
ncbi:unnamed protein product [Protopolystoma xenopodis]|uniref:Uncharacterized protein n=1 Tax=Protopolystoma xenopodis TaxID=117903 RepID=A0A448WJ23_9PLAT|nr:unnamed protein product [Protopolystoma xenopodis]